MKRTTKLSKKGKNMTQVIDARGLACPQPVLLTKKALQTQAAVTTIVDNEPAELNVRRMAEKQGCRIETEKKPDGIYLNIRAAEQPQSGQVGQINLQPAEGALVLVINNRHMGHGDDSLGALLIRALMHTLGEVNPLPDSMIFFNSAVYLTVGESPVVEDLKQLSKRGVRILVCGTCLGHFNLTDQVQVGEVSNMYTIAETMLQAGRVINL